mgnify:CR=1 FL=1
MDDDYLSFIFLAMMTVMDAHEYNMEGLWTLWCLVLSGCCSGAGREWGSAQLRGNWRDQTSQRRGQQKGRGVSRKQPVNAVRPTADMVPLDVRLVCSFRDVLIPSPSVCLNHFCTCIQVCVCVCVLCFLLCTCFFECVCVFVSMYTCIYLCYCVCVCVNECV